MMTTTTTVTVPLTIIDFLSRKSEAITSIPDYVSHVENIHKTHKLKSFRSDNGGEYTSEALKKVFNPLFHKQLAVLAAASSR
jgi:hypothetical protein